MLYLKQKRGKIDAPTFVKHTCQCWTIWSHMYNACTIFKLQIKFHKIMYKFNSVETKTKLPLFEEMMFVLLLDSFIFQKNLF